MQNAKDYGVSDVVKPVALLYGNSKINSVLVHEIFEAYGKKKPTTTPKTPTVANVDEDVED